MSYAPKGINNNNNNNNNTVATVIYFLHTKPRGTNFSRVCRYAAR